MRFTGRLASRNQTDIRGLAILLALNQLGGRVKALQVLDLLERILEPVLTDRDIAPEYRGDYRACEHRWHHQIHGTLSHSQMGLRSNGFMLPAKVGEHGTWILSEKGKQRIRTLLQTGVDPVSAITLAELTEGLNLSFIKDDKLVPAPVEQVQPITVSKPGRQPRENGATMFEANESRHIAILLEETTHIQDFLRGKSALRPDDPTLCDWVWFCYKFEMYVEGATLLPLIHPESVEHSHYERTKKLAEICALRME